MAFLLIILILIGYFTAWVINPGTGLTFHAFDLAEWASLHPAVRAESPPLTTTLMLRLPLLCCGIMLAMTAHYADRRVRWLHRIGAFGILLGLLPPLDFITQTSNVNYQQQLGLAAIAFITVIWSSTRYALKPRIALGILAAFIALISGVLGVSRAVNLMTSLGLPTQMGVSVWVMSVLLVCWIALVGFGGWQSRKKEQGDPSTRTPLSSSHNA